MLGSKNHRPSANIALEDGRSLWQCHKQVSGDIEAGIEVLVTDFKKRWDRQSRAFSNLFRQADKVEKLAEFIQRLEQGDLKLRVRRLESERAFKRVASAQKAIGNAVMAGTLVNLATILYINSIRMPAMAAYIKVPVDIIMFCGYQYC